MKCSIFGSRSVSYPHQQLFTSNPYSLIPNPQPMDLVLFGVQGSGKGTQAKRIASEFGYSIFEAGGELRAIAASGSELGETVQSYMSAGNLVPHEIIMQVVKEAIAARPADQKILFDGIPRDSAQQQDFDAILQEAGRDFCCVQILLSEEEAIERILGRAEKEGRKDDSDETVIRKRISTFTEKTVPVIEDYRARGLMTDIDGKGTPDEVYERLAQQLTINN
jgi:adenylate kinase